MNVKPCKATGCTQPRISDEANDALSAFDIYSEFCQEHTTALLAAWIAAAQTNREAAAV